MRLVKALLQPFDFGRDLLGREGIRPHGHVVGIVHLQISGQDAIFRQQAGVVPGARVGRIDVEDSDIHVGSIQELPRDIKDVAGLMGKAHHHARA